MIAIDATDGRWTTRHFRISRNAGAKWIQKTTAFEFNSVTWAPQNASVFYLWQRSGSDNQIYQTTDGGDTFGAITFPARSYDSVEDLIADPNDSQTLYLSGATGSVPFLLKTTDAGGSFVRLRPQIRTGYNYLIGWAALPQSDSFLAFDAWGFVYRTMNGGRYWRKLTWLPYSADGKILAADNEGRHFFAVTDARLYESIDGAEHWRELTATISQVSSFKIVTMSDPKIAPLCVATNLGVFIRD